MLKEQKKLLADIRAAERAALALHGRGVKIANVVQKLRSAGDEMETRVRFLEKQAKETKTAPAADAAATEQP